MSDALLQAREVSFSYGSRRILRGVSLSVPAGAYVSVIGPNGSGKTTLFRLLCGARRCPEGQVLYGGRDVNRIPVSERARLFAAVHQSEENGFPFTCLETVLLGLHPHQSRFGSPTAEQRAFILDIMEHTGTLALADQPVTQISGGEFQRVVLARALAQKPRVLFLDEAMSDLDISAKIRMTSYLRSLAAETGLTVVAVNHDLASAYRSSDLVAALRQGEVAAFGPPEQVMTPAFFADVFGVEAETVPGKGFFIRDSYQEKEISHA